MHVEHFQLMFTPHKSATDQIFIGKMSKYVKPSQTNVREEIKAAAGSHLRSFPSDQIFPTRPEFVKYSSEIVLTVKHHRKLSNALAPVWPTKSICPRTMPRECALDTVIAITRVCQGLIRSHSCHKALPEVI